MSIAVSTPIEESLLGQITTNLLKLSKDGFLAIDRNFKYVYWSEGMQRISGISAKEVIGRNAFDVFPFLRETGQEQIFKSALAGEQVSVVGKPFVIPESGKKGYFNASYYPHYSATGKVLGVLIIVTDVTEQKILAEAQGETEDRFRNMADSSPVMLWMAGKDGLCSFFNQSWLQFSGKTLAQELGVGWAEGVHPFDFQRCMDTYLACFNERQPFEMEYRLLRHDGEYRLILDRGVPRYSPNRVFEGYIGSCIDITERKTLEDELRKAVRVREEFLSIASHELKTPLTSLNLQVQMLQYLFNETKDFEKIAEQIPPMMTVARRQIRLMADLIEKLLDISRIESGTFSLEFAKMDLYETVKDVVQQLTDLAEQAQCPITVTGKALIGKWDGGRIGEVISNLIMNAVKYAAGSPVAVRIQAKDNTAILEVEDQGPGINEDDLQKVFEKFHRGSQSKNAGGLGLGLFIVKQIVEGHGGRISAQKGASKGTLFRVVLPLER